MKLPQFVQPHVVTIEPYEGEGAYGPIYGDTYTIKGYYVEKEEYSRNDDGDEVLSSSQLYTSENITLQKKSKLTFESNTKEVLTTNRNFNAMTGQHSNSVVMLK